MRNAVQTPVLLLDDMHNKTTQRLAEGAQEQET